MIYKAYSVSIFAYFGKIVVASVTIYDKYKESNN